MGRDYSSRRLTYAGMVLLILMVLVVGCARPAPAPSPATPAPTPAPLPKPSPVSPATPTPTATQPTAPAPAPTATPTPTAKPSPTSAAPSGELRIAVGTFGTGSMDPIKADAINTPALLSEVYDSMFRMEAGKLVPGVVEQWSIASDGLSWTFSVRKGIKFQDGSDLTAKDVKFSIERYISKDAWYANLRNAVDRVDLVDNYTVRLYTKGVQPFLPSYMASISPAQGLVMPMDYINKNGVDYFVKNPIGSGPWQFVKYVQGDSIQYTARASHWRQTPAFKTLTVMLIPEATTRVAMLKAGDVDVADVSLDDAIALEKAGYTTYPTTAGQGRIQFHGTYDPRAKGMPTADVRVRQALTIAINQDEIAKALFYDKALPLMPPRIVYGQDDVDTDYWVQYSKQFYQYDSAKAKKLLADAGYPNGFSGLKLFVTKFPGLEYADKLALIVQQYWKAIGVNADLVPLELANFLTYRKEPADVLVGNVTFGTTNLSPSLVMFEQIYGSKGTNPLLSRNTPQGITGYTPDLDKLIYASLTEVDTTKRQTQITQAIKAGMDTYTVIPFRQLPAMMAVGPKAKFDFKQPLEHGFLPQWADIAQHR